MQYVQNLHPQADALELMGMDVGESKGSMWIQAFKICNNNWVAFTEDQERNKPLVSTRFYTNRWAKELPATLMTMFIQEVRNSLSFFLVLSLSLSLSASLCLSVSLSLSLSLGQSVCLSFFAFVCVFVCRSPTRAWSR